MLLFVGVGTLLDNEEYSSEFEVIFSENFCTCRKKNTHDRYRKEKKREKDDPPLPSAGSHNAGHSGGPLVPPCAACVGNFSRPRNKHDRGISRG